MKLVYNTVMNDKLSKATFDIDGNDIHVQMPFTKVDRENRLVSGFATLDNIDKQGDVVDAEASIEAFSTTQARIREMHRADSAVGRIVKFTPQEYFDPDTNKTYKGVYVTAYVSKGAQDTWEKVLDGTLSGFSIGGAIKEKDFVKHANSASPIRHIKKYVLNELSLVDNPCNQYSTILSIQKNDAGEDVLKGSSADLPLENVFYCDKDEIAVSSADETKSCMNCDKPMTSIGWFERVDNTNEITTKFATIVEDYKTNLHNNDNDGNIITKQEGGNNMSDEKTEATKTDAVEEVKDPATDTGKVDDVTEAVEVKAEDGEVVEEVKDVNLEKMFSDFQTAVTDILTKSAENATEQISSTKDEFKAVVDALEGKVESLTKVADDLNTKFETLNKSVSTVETKVETVEKGTATKKSNDLGGSEGDETITKRDSESIWSGTYLDVSSL